MVEPNSPGILAKSGGKCCLGGKSLNEAARAFSNTLIRTTNIMESITITDAIRELSPHRDAEFVLVSVRPDATLGDTLHKLQGAENNTTRIRRWDPIHNKEEVTSKSVRLSDSCSPQGTK